LKLTKEQSQEIKDQQSQQNQTKRVTVPALESVLYEAIPALDHGSVRIVDYMGDDTSIVQSARVSYGVQKLYIMKILALFQFIE